MVGRKKRYFYNTIIVKFLPVYDIILINVVLVYSSWAIVIGLEFRRHKLVTFNSSIAS